MPINGITLEQDRNWNICYINEFSDELKDIIRKELNVICYGKNHVEEDARFYSYSKTLREFLARYNPKTIETKKGMLGELLAHLLIKKIIIKLEPISIFFNKEERSIKKGFDQNYIESEAHVIWYGEVKSGGKAEDQTPDTANTALLRNAKTDIANLLTRERANVWENVITDADLNFKLEEGLIVKELLRGDVAEIEVDPDAKKSVILISVLYHDINTRITSDSVRQLLETVVEEDIFQDIIVFTIQKSTLEKIERFLQAECED